MSRTNNTATQRKQPTTPEERQRLAAEGNVEAIWQLLTAADPALLNREEVYSLLLRAVEVASQKAPAQFAADLFGRMMALTGYLVLRGHILCRRACVAHDRDVRGRGSLYFPGDVERELLPGLIELQRHATEIAEAQARVARIWKLAGRQEATERARQPSARRGTQDQRPKAAKRTRCGRGTTDAAPVANGGKDRSNGR